MEEVEAHVPVDDEDHAVVNEPLDAASAVAAVATWPPTDDIYLELLRTYDLRPSEIDALRSPPTADATLDDTRIVHLTDRYEVQEAARRYADGVVFEKKHHEDALKMPAPLASLLLVVPAAAQPPYATARSILLFTRKRRGSVQIVHTRAEWGGRGYASRLARAVKDEVPPRGSLSIESPGCTARSAVKLWLRALFMGDDELLKCKLADDAAYMGGRSVRLSFVWHKETTAADEEARVRFLQAVAVKHPELKRVCTDASTRRV